MDTIFQALSKEIIDANVKKQFDKLCKWRLEHCKWCDAAHTRPLFFQTLLGNLGPRRRMTTLMAAVREKAYPMGNPGILGTPQNSMEPHHTKESLDKKNQDFKYQSQLPGDSSKVTDLFLGWSRLQPLSSGRICQVASLKLIIRSENRQSQNDRIVIQPSVFMFYVNSLEGNQRVGGF